MSFSNATLPLAASLPPLPEYTLTQRPSLIPGLTDGHLKLLAPPIIYWIFGGFWYLVDRWDLFPRNKIHTPEEELKRNRVTLREVCINMLKQQGLQLGMGFFTMPEHAKIEFVGRQAYDIAVWARRLRYVEQLLPNLLAVTGIDSGSMANRLAGSYPYLAGALRGGDYPWLTQTVMTDGVMQTVSAFTSGELLFGQAMYWVVVPIFRLGLAIALIDLWQYSVHRLLHTNKWLYCKCQHLPSAPQIILPTYFPLRMTKFLL
jgi:sphinganine C4-monooxygenase